MHPGGAVSETFAVTDSRGNTYHNAILFNQTVDGDTIGMFYAEKIAGGENTVTVSDTTMGTLRVAILEYSGIATSGSLDVVAFTAQGNSATPPKWDGCDDGQWGLCCWVRSPRAIRRPSRQVAVIYSRRVCRRNRGRR